MQGALLRLSLRAASSRSTSIRVRRIGSMRSVVPASLSCLAVRLMWII